MSKKALCVQKKKRISPLNIFGYIVLIGGGLVLVYPLVFMVLAGLMTKMEFMTTDLGLFPISKNPTLNNLLLIISPGSQISKLVLNTLIRTVYVAFFAVLTALLGGYCFNRLKFRGREKIFLALLFTQTLPAMALIVPTYIEFARWPFAGGNIGFFGGMGIIDTWAVYLIGGPAINIMGTFLVKQSLEKVPFDYDEAAKIDGANTFDIIFRIIAPLEKSIIAFIAITTIIAVWNDWAVPFYYTNGQDLLTLAGEVARQTIGNGVINIPDWPYIITLSLGLTIPSLCVFLFFQRYIIEGLANVGIKG